MTAEYSKALRFDPAHTKLGPQHPECWITDLGLFNNRLLQNHPKSSGLFMIFRS